jgi:hypothetical protein
MPGKMALLCNAILLFFVFPISAVSQAPPQTTQTQADDSEARPAVTKADLEIVEHARKILDSPAKWNRADNRNCPSDQTTFSLYCALEKATYEVTGSFAHRGAAMQEARFVIEEVAPDWKKYNHRLMDYNNDPKTTFADIQKVFQLLHDHIEKRLADQKPPAKN